MLAAITRRAPVCLGQRCAPITHRKEVRTYSLPPALNVSGNTASNCVLWLIITRNAFDACDLPLIAAENRSHFPVGKRDLGKDAHLHRHIVLDHYLLAAQRLRDSGDRMAHYYDDANLHRSILARQRGAARLSTKELDRRSHYELHSCCRFPSDTM